MSLLVTKAKTAAALGVANLARAINYRVRVRFGVNRVRHIGANVPAGEFFRADTFTPVSSTALSWRETAKLFSCYSFPVTDMPPDWHANPLTGIRIAEPERDWWLISDFDPAVGDIKVLWELSRFDWVIAFAQQVRAGNTEVLERLNNWLNDWCLQNPPYKGPNWKCGQEASIRVMHLAMAAVILDQAKMPLSTLADLIEVHLRRIEPTISYAMAQDNNHGTSEAAAMFIGGSWLASLGRPKGAKWAKIGRKWLENRASRLIAEDGSFSQYSLNYHRVMIDTFSMIEVWRRCLELAEFSPHLKKRVKDATHWLYTMVNRWNGDGPNLGANDGARLLQLTVSDYRDFRPSTQLAAVLFTGARAYGEPGEWNEHLKWLGLELPDTCLPNPESDVFNHGGFAVLCDGDVKAVFRYPRFRFRPSQADALHVDLWLKDRNLLRDAGTYSYNTEARWLRYFPGTESHNTIQFDDRDQMPRLSRFLFGDWLKTSVFKPLTSSGGEQALTAGYKDRENACHTRTIRLRPNLLKITDKVTGFKEKAILRWRLEPGDWQMKDDILINGSHTIKVKSDTPIKRYELVQGWESRYYLEKQLTPVLEVEVNQPSVLITEYRWSL